jgi:hypothetical protein
LLPSINLSSRPLPERWIARSSSEAKSFPSILVMATAPYFGYL